MINPQELRIGNIIHRTRNNIDTGSIEDVPVIVDGNLIKELELHPYLGYNPIPLTPELLQAAGFVPHNDDYLYRKGGNFFLHRYAFGGKNMDGNEYCFQYKDYKSKSIFYLHQLQNLYFALTGQELEIKLPVTHYLK